MDESKYLSTAQVASLLGVGVSTVKRWVDGAILPAYKTPGGHRKLLWEEVVRLAREGRLGPLDSTRWTSAGPVQLTSEDWKRRLIQALLDRDGPAVALMLHSAVASGLPVAVLGDQVLGPAMASIGHQWETGRLDVYQEHHATQLCAAGLFELRSRFSSPQGIARPLALGGGPEGDPYLLVHVLIELVLLEAGWKVVNLGPNTPLASFTKAVQDHRPRLVWISATHLVDPECFLREYAGLQARAQEVGAALAVGGQALKESIRSRMQYTTFGDGLTHLADFARKLHPLPKRPHRGRPSGSK